MTCCHGLPGPQRRTHIQKLMTKRKNHKLASSRAAGHRVDHPRSQRSTAMTSTSMIALIALPQVPGKLLEMVVEGQTVLPYREIWLKACNGELPMVIFERGRWKVPEPEMPALAEALGLRLKQPDRPARPR